MIEYVNLYPSRLSLPRLGLGSIVRLYNWFHHTTEYAIVQYLHNQLVYDPVLVQYTAIAPQEVMLVSFAQPQ